MKKIRFTINSDGEVKLDVDGALGAECDVLTEPFEASLGVIANKQRKDSFFATSESEVETHSRGGT